MNELKYLIFDYCKRIGFAKERSYYSMKCFLKKDFLLLPNKLIENILDLVILKNTIHHL